MNTDHCTRARNAIMGAFVADAAALGLHWVYSQRRIRELAPDTPEFREPDAADFEGGVGYFAHAGKRAGELSQYGEQMLVMLRSLAESGGRFDRASYTEHFRQHFGYGGEFVGYIDSPTRQTLDRIYRDEHDAMQAVDAIPYDGDPKHKHAMLTKVLAAAKQYEGDGLRARVEWYAADMPEPDASVAYGLALVGALAGSAEFPGAIDEQLPAVSKLPPLVACHLDDPDLVVIAESAIRVTNNTPRAIDYGRVCTELLRASLAGEPIDAALTAATNVASDKTQHILLDALSSHASVRELSKSLGLHCDLGAGVPGLMYNAQSASSFTEAVRRNIAAGGDSCGRAIVLGAVCGARFGIGGRDGIPQSWIDRLVNRERLETPLAALFP